MRLPRLPVSRRRHSESQLERRVEDLKLSLAEVEKQRDEALAEVSRQLNKTLRWSDATNRAIAERDEAIERAMIAERQLEDSRERDDLIGEQRDAALNRVAELEAAIRTFCDKRHNGVVAVEGGKQRLRAVLDGHDRQKVPGPDATFERMREQGYPIVRQEADGDH